MSVTLSEVKRAAKARRAPLAGESAGYLVLAIADQVLSAPRLVEASDIQLTEDGTLRVLSGTASSDAVAELGLRRALDQLLLVASSGSAALARASRRATPIGLAAFVRELEAALIPVNRAAARRALARVHRETARALASGSLPAEQTEEPSMPLAPFTPQPPELPAVAVVAAVPVEVAPVVESHLNGVLTALSEELLAPAELQESDARTVALEVRPIVVPPVQETALEFDVDFEIEAEVEAADSSAAPTVMRAVEVRATMLDVADLIDDTPSELPVEALTRPEPAMIRKSLRAMLPVELLPTPDASVLLRTPTLGSLAARLPVLEPEQLRMEAGSESERVPDLTVVTSALVPVSEEETEPMPEVAPLAPGVAIVASKQSDVSELLSSFQVAPMAGDESSLGLCRAIKELAELDLTPAPFAALIR